MDNRTLYRGPNICNTNKDKKYAGSYFLSVILPVIYNANSNTVIPFIK